VCSLENHLQNHILKPKYSSENMSYFYFSRSHSRNLFVVPWDLKAGMNIVQMLDKQWIGFLPHMDDWGLLPFFLLSIIWWYYEFIFKLFLKGAQWLHLWIIQKNSSYRCGNHNTKKEVNVANIRIKTCKTLSTLF